MAKSEDLLHFDVAALGQKLRGREISPVELTDAYLERIRATEPKLHAYITVTEETARAAAREAESEITAGRWRGPFHGVPIALKDLCYTKGIRTTGGSKILADFMPEYDSTVWSRLKEQGAVLLGKLNLHEFAYGVTSSNPHHGFVHNPYNLDHIPGGSSGGSGAAIVARSAAATIGSDTGGSIRIPAAYCGCIGLKQTWSRVSRYGVIPLSDSLDHAGPITRTVRDAALMLQVIAGHDPNDGTSSHEPVPDYMREISRGIKGMRIGIIKELNNRLDTEVERAFGAAIKTLGSCGAMVDEVSAPALEAGNSVFAVLAADALEYHEKWLKQRPRDYGEDVLARLEAALITRVTDYIRGQRARVLMLSDAMRALQDCDVLLAPVAATTAPRIKSSGVCLDDEGKEFDLMEKVVRFTLPFDATGQPALAIPTGMGSNGLPLAMQFIGKPFDEAAVFRAAAAYEEARGPLPEPKI
jgi:aspartyl-tRNA(Asn)/glutamyl-tRNA(Gln) amidotransferase subunit A